MISRRRFSFWVMLLVFCGLLLNFTFLRRGGPTSSSDADEDAMADHRSPRSNLEDAAATILTQTTTSRLALQPLLDDEVRRGATCKASHVALESRLPDIAESHGRKKDAPRCSCARAVVQDVDHGRTLSHIMKRYYCTHPQYPLATAGRAMRIVQVGANTGDNANDHLVTFLKSGVAQGVLLEPVPWIFARLSKTYQDHRGTVQLLNAAMSESNGNVSFMAPNEKTSGWLPQMGGLSLPAKTRSKLVKTGGIKNFDKITVQSTRFETLLAQMGWAERDHAKAPPDVFVVDAEGYDAVIMGMVLDSVHTTFGSTARIPIMQYEWKHIAPKARTDLWDRLGQLGYCVMQVHYDDVAIHEDALAMSMGKVDGCEASYDISSTQR